MIRSKTVVFLFALAVLGMWFFQPLMSDALAVDTSCEFHASLTDSTGYLVYSVSAGAGGTEYTATTDVTGDVELVGPAPSLTGPADIDSVEVHCMGGNGSATVHVEICALPVCYGIYDIGIKTYDNCSMFQAPFVPSMTEWGLIILFVALLGTGAFVIRRKRAVARS